MTFASLLVRLGLWAQARGIDEVVFRWDLRGWSAGAPNEGRRWTVECGQAIGRGAVGAEALENIVEAAESTP